ncbi:sce7726 family protein [Paenibacillus sp. FSL M7-0420]|uniref:sce7726 family protein n=1 Tax=Paenibacillus sp. FSL M7-0420 TaxID=2921609 RepID=UPI0030F93A03
MKTRDIDIRTHLHTLLKYEHSDPDTIVLDELGLCQGEARIDVAVINGSMNGYEIKSESDTLERLPKQSEIYSKVFDTVTIVTASKFVDGIDDIIPKWWGIKIAELDCDGGMMLFDIRKARKNRKIDAYSLAQLLWRDEAIDLLKKKGLQKGYLSKPREILWRVLSENIPTIELKDEVRAILKSRENWRVH